LGISVRVAFEIIEWYKSIVGTPSSSYLLFTYLAATIDSSVTIIHIAKGVTRRSAAPVAILGGNPKINTDQARSRIIIAEKRTRPLLLYSKLFSLFFDNCK